MGRLVVAIATTIVQILTKDGRFVREYDDSAGAAGLRSAERHDLHRGLGVDRARSPWVAAGVRIGTSRTASDTFIRATRPMRLRARWAKGSHRRRGTLHRRSHLRGVTKYVKHSVKTAPASLY